jgi:hypothetical protein
MCAVLLPPGVNQICAVLLPPGVNQICAVLLPPGVNQMCAVLLPPGVNQICAVLLPPGVNQICAVLLPSGVNPTAVKYIYQIVWLRTTKSILPIVLPYYKLGKLLPNVKCLVTSEALLEFNRYPANVEYRVSC